MNSVLHLLGLARKGGNLAVGEDAVAEAVERRTARLLLVAVDASENTRERGAHSAEGIRVPCLTVPFSKEELGGALGRGTCAILALTDAGLAGAVAGGLARMDEAQYGEAAQHLRERARRTLQRQKKKRTQAKARAAAQCKPWASPPKEGPSGRKTRPGRPGQRRDG